MKAKSKVQSSKKHLKPVEMLKEDHKKVKQLFKDFENTESSSRKEKIVNTVIQELKTHTQLEEELFYPAARKQLKSEEGQDLMDEAAEEHHVVDLLIAELETMSAEDDRYDAKFTVLSENVKHHIKEEEGDLFLRIKKGKANSEELGLKMQQRKKELQENIKNEGPKTLQHAA